MDTTPRVVGSVTRVETPVLRAHAGFWDGTSRQFGDQAAGVADLSLAGARPGPFSRFLTGYEGMVQELRDRLAEASAATAAIADTLSQVTGLYETSDVDHHHTLSNMHDR